MNGRFPLRIAEDSELRSPCLVNGGYCLSFHLFKIEGQSMQTDDQCSIGVFTILSIVCGACLRLEITSRNRQPPAFFNVCFRRSALSASEIFPWSLIFVKLWTFAFSSNLSRKFIPHRIRQSPSLHRISSIEEKHRRREEANNSIRAHLKP